MIIKANTKDVFRVRFTDGNYIRVMAHHACKIVEPNGSRWIGVRTVEGADVIVNVKHVVNLLMEPK